MAGSGVVLFAALLVPILGQNIPPGAPAITGPNFIIMGEQISLECTSTGGNPSPTVKWFEADVLIDDSFQQSGNVVTNVYNFVAQKRHNLIVFECQVDNEVLQNPLTSTWFVQVYSAPNTPKLTGPTDIIDGTSSTHTCVSTGGNPNPVMTMRLGQTTLTAADGITETVEYSQANVSYVLTQTITWTPRLSDNGQRIFCQVDHPETRPNNPQIVSLQLKVKVALSINAPQLLYNPTIGNNLVIQCVVTGTATSVRWTKDNSQLNINGNSRLSNGNTGTPSLTISNVQSSDNGQYVCSATDESKTVNTNVITVSPQSLPTVTIQSSTYTGQYGNSVTLVCTVSAVPFQTSVYWLKDGFSQINSGDSGYSGSTTNNPSLTINSVTTNDQGTYRCFATNVVGTGQSLTTQLTVQGGLLSVTIDQTSLSAVLGSNSVTIGCTNDEANYVCSATNIAGTSSSQNAFLDVTGNIPTVTIPSPTYSILYGNPITIECQITANPQHTTVTWETVNNGVPSTINIGNSAKYFGGSVNTPSLTISNTVTSDSGIYRCSATNAVGTGTSQETTLSVTGSVLTVNIPQSTYREDYSDTVTLECIISGTPAATRVYWEATKNDVTTQIEVTNSIKYSGSSISTPSLTISNAILEDEGVYKCFAENVVGLAESNPTTLDIVGNNLVKYDCTFHIAQSKHADVIDNIFSCLSDNLPHEPEQMTPGSDEGNYRCHATNIVGTGRSSQGFLDIQGQPPTVVVTLPNYAVDFGQQVTLGCTSTSTVLDVVGNIPSVVSSQTTVDVAGGIPVVALLSNSYSVVVSVVGNIPVVNVEKSTYSVNYGESVTLVCTVTAAPQHTTVFWKKVQGGQEVAIDMNTAKYIGSTVNQPSLTIANIDMNDETFYICFASNSVGTGQSSQTYVDVLGNVPVVRVLSNSYSVLLGNTATLECVITANPTATIVQWYRVINGQQQNIDSSSSNYNTPTVNNPSLSVLSARNSDEGYYICSASNAVGTASSAQTFLDVTGNIPTVTVSLPNYNTNIGATVTLGCTVIATPPANTVYWKRINANGQTIDIDTNSNRYDGASITNPSLVIYNPDLSDEGNYVCYASNAIGTGNSQQTFLDVTGNTPNVKVLQIGTGQSSQTYLDIIGSIPIVNIGSNSYNVNYGNSITLVCTVTANPIHNSVSWTKIQNGVQTAINIDGSKYSGATVSQPSLVISNAGNSDESFYVCSATNSIGKGQSSQTYLDVVGDIPVVQILSNYYSVEIATNAVGTGSSSQSYVDVTGSVLSVNVPQPSYSANYGQSVQSQSQQTQLQIVGSVPSVTIGQGYTVNLGSSVTIQCTVFATPSASSVTWKKISSNGAESFINVANSVKYNGGTVGTPSLTVLNAGDSDEAYYVCSATNAAGTGTSAQSFLDVLGSLPVVTVPQPHVGTGSSAQTYLNVVGSIPVSQQTFLDVVGSIPTVTVPVPNYTVNRGASVTLECQYSANPAATSVTWEKVVNGQATDVILTNNKYGGSSISSPSLIVNSAEESDQASYICKVTNPIGTGISTATNLDVVGNIPVVTASPLAYSSTQVVVAVAGSVPSVTLSQTSFSASYGDDTTLGCIISSNPTYTSVYWQKIVTGETPTTIDVSNTAKYSGSTVANPDLTIRNIGSGDIANYVCFAANSVGTGRSNQGPLNVVGSPPTVRISQSSQAFLNVVGNVPTVTATTVQSARARNDVGTGSSNQVYLDIIGDPPSGITINPAKIVIEEGQTISATCLAQGSPSIIYTWYKEGSITVIKTGNILEINNAPRTALGTYTCRASNNYGSMEATTIVDVQYAPVVVISQTTSSFDGQGRQSINIPCSYMSNPAATSVFWTKYNPVAGTNSGNTNLIEIDGNKYQGANLNSPSLTIYNLDRSDAGSYRCSAANIIGQGESNYVTLNIDTNAAPSYIRIRPSQVTVEEGNGYTLTCEADGDPSPLYEWYYKDVKIHEGPVLTISNAAYNNNDGLHTCKATNVVGSRQATVDVDVKYAPISAVDQASFNPALNNAVTLRCNTLANPSSTHWVWKYNGFDLDFTEKNYLVDMDSTSDVGKYTCIAFNEVGQSAEIDFTVELADPLTPAPKIVETTVSAGLTGGEIAAICLAVLFGILLIVIIIVCCVVQGCCGRKREKKERYIEREVIRTEMPYRQEAIPVVKEPSVVSVREVTPRIGYMESVREVPRISYVDDSYRYMSTQSRPYYLPVVEATYDDEEYRKQKKKKKSKKNRMYGQDLAADNEIYLEERVVGSVRGSRKGDEIITGPEMYFEAE
ncbi:HMCN [Mytilus coruscus]|uniref:HMCN n=1 Tax=Mytilus coruscus TaxID=42192 RepID=A0A6J8CDS3_MYTCO|nr:HMCN [Mytilus coruscus]